MFHHFSCSKCRKKIHRETSSPPPLGVWPEAARPCLNQEEEFKQKNIYIGKNDVNNGCVDVENVNCGFSVNSWDVF